ncbi:MAG: CaiB/BaiF family protein [Acidimicrobiales bacterium]|nr:CaiB/BaiF family protein [Acidimicrobiales bacterium]
MTGTMSGVRVLEVAAWTYVPAAGAVLAEWGADVIKIEHPESGDPQRGLVTSGLVPSGPGGVNHMIELPNRGKRSVGLDLKSAAGRELLMKLAATSDVFLTNMRPDAIDSLRLSVDDLRSANPNIIYVRGSGQGVRGDEAGKGGFDGSHFWGRTTAGLSATKGDEPPPGQPGAAWGDLQGGLTIAGGIAAALFHRERTGEPTVVDNSLLANGMWAGSATLMAAGLFGFDQMPAPSREAVPNPLIGYYRTGDGRYLTLMMLQSDRWWPDLARRLGRPELVDDPRFVDAAARFEHKAACVAVLDEIFATRTLAEWREALADSEGVWAAVETPGELLVDPQALANGYVRDVVHSSGSTFRMIPSPLQFDEQPPDLVRAPDHGEHTDEVLTELGIGEDELIQLKIDGAVL